MYCVRFQFLKDEPFEKNHEIRFELHGKYGLDRPILTDTKFNRNQFSNFGDETDGHTLTRYTLICARKTEIYVTLPKQPCDGNEW
jgi:hypothetical protein